MPLSTTRQFFFARKNPRTRRAERILAGRARAPRPRVHERGAMGRMMDGFGGRGSAPADAGRAIARRSAPSSNGMMSIGGNVYSTADLSRGVRPADRERRVDHQPAAPTEPGGRDGGSDDCRRQPWLIVSSHRRYATPASFRASSSGCLPGHGSRAVARMERLISARMSDVVARCSTRSVRSGESSAARRGGGSSSRR
jgi:hypothetical protein